MFPKLDNYYSIVKVSTKVCIHVHLLHQRWKGFICTCFRSPF